MDREYGARLDQVRPALHYVNMSMDDSQPVWPFDFTLKHDDALPPLGAGTATTVSDALMVE